jgi:hypothetical protein
MIILFKKLIVQLVLKSDIIGFNKSFVEIDKKRVCLVIIVSIIQKLFGAAKQGVLKFIPCQSAVSCVLMHIEVKYDGF